MRSRKRLRAEAGCVTKTSQQLGCNPGKNTTSGSTIPSRSCAVPPTGVELPQDLAENSKVRKWDDAHSDAFEVLNQVDNARLVALIEQWPVLSDRVKDEILKLAEHDKATKLPRECGAE